MNSISIEQYHQILLQSASVPLIDVRSPVEFAEGSIPGSINLPLLNNEERHLVGLCYKQHGQAAALQLGHQLVSGENLKEKLDAWKKFIAENPKALITCFRGGLRSQSAQKFLAAEGIMICRIDEGYKGLRNLFLDHLLTRATTLPVFILSGTTGSGKTHLLNDVSSFYPTIDLEGLAHHRGSAFGAWAIPQPSQIDFENRLSSKCMFWLNQQIKKPLLLEDESRMIGTCHIPEPFFLTMRSAPVILVEEPIENRIHNIYEDYISSQIQAGHTPVTEAQRILQKYKNSVMKIQKKLGGLRAAELLQDLEKCEQQYAQHQLLEDNKLWIEKLLIWYYDPMYTGSLEKRQPTVHFKGTRNQIKDFLRAL